MFAPIDGVPPRDPPRPPPYIRNFNPETPLDAGKGQAAAKQNSTEATVVDEEKDEEEAWNSEQASRRGAYAFYAKCTGWVKVPRLPRHCRALTRRWLCYCRGAAAQRLTQSTKLPQPDLMFAQGFLVGIHRLGTKNSWLKFY
ncbi:hypothetical protein DFH09DRAFT_1110735 [Mycena vulgaris]|nr:hypothetical protein DFH09DRAFT_1110735 [Mycena vulgaris]